jgi:hypothetical protein
VTPASQNSPRWDKISAEEGRVKVAYSKTVLGAARHDVRGLWLTGQREIMTAATLLCAGEGLDMDRAEESRKGETTVGSRCTKLR